MSSAPLTPFWYLPTARPLDRDTELLWGQFAFYTFVAGMITGALGAYAIGPIPLDYLSRVIFLASAALMLISGTLPSIPEFVPALLLFVWALIGTTGGLLDNRLHLWMPILSTPYPVFIALRFMNILAPVSCGYLLVIACERYSFEKVTKFIIWLGTIVALYALYAYVAELFGLPEIFRSRAGTGGGAQSTTFSYAFHRALGTFREPSHLAEWLQAPLFTSLAMRNRVVNVHTMIMLVALLLTGSLAGYGGFIGGLGAAALLANPLRASSWKVLGGILGALALGLAGFLVFASGKNIDVLTLFHVVSDRIEPMLHSGGLQNSDRGDVLSAVLKEDVTLFGYGLGRANVVLSNIYTAGMADPTLFVLSYISLYLHYLYATGVVGLGLLLLFIVTPIFQFWNHRVVSVRRQFSFIAGGVVAFAVTNILLFDEMTPQFVAMIGLVIATVRLKERHIRHNSRIPNEHGPAEPSPD